MSDNHPPADASTIKITKHSSAEEIATQCVRIKREISILQTLLNAHPHEDEKKELLGLFDRAHAAFQDLQTHVSNR